MPREPLRRNSTEKRCAAVWRRLDNQRAAHQRQAFADAEQTKSVLPPDGSTRIVLVKSASVILYAKADLRGIGLENHANSFGIGVLRNISHSFLEHAIKGNLNWRRYSCPLKICYKIHVRIEALAPFFEIIGHSRFQTEIVERGGPELP